MFGEQIAFFFYLVGFFLKKRDGAMYTYRLLFDGKRVIPTNNKNNGRRETLQHESEWETKNILEDGQHPSFSHNLP